jgi:predicted transport protein
MSKPLEPPKVNAPDTNPPPGNLEDSTPNGSDLVGQVIQHFKGNVVNYLQQEYGELRQQLTKLDDQLGQRYPQRYLPLKQQTQQQVETAWNHVKLVATPVIDRIQTLNPEVVQQHHARLDAKVGHWGQTIAHIELKLKQNITQRFQQWWITATEKR